MRPAEILWGAWALALFVALCAALWPWVVLAPSRARAWRVASAGARLLLWGTGTPVAASGLEHLRAARRPCVVVANHTSELDAIALAAALPLQPAVLAKAELARNPLLRWPLRRLGAVFIQRGAPRPARPQLELAVEALRAGRSLLVFPEGTFRRSPGLLPFRRGAFVAAACAGAPVVPVALRGARAMTPREGGLPRRGAIAVDVGPPLEPSAGREPEWAALALLLDARRFLLERTQEPSAA